MSGIVSSPLNLSNFGQRLHFVGFFVSCIVISLSSLSDLVVFPIFCFLSLSGFGRRLDQVILLFIGPLPFLSVFFLFFKYFPFLPLVSLAVFPPCIPSLVLAWVLVWVLLRILGCFFLEVLLGLGCWVLVGLVGRGVPEGAWVVGVFSRFCL